MEMWKQMVPGCQMVPGIIVGTTVAYKQLGCFRFPQSSNY